MTDGVHGSAENGHLVNLVDFYIVCIQDIQNHDCILAW